METANVISGLKALARVAQLNSMSVGDRVHLNTRRGIYRVSAIYRDGFQVTCDKWEATGRKPLECRREHFHCHAPKHN